MESLENLYKKLEQYKDFSNENNIDDFLDVVDLIALKKQSKSIRHLLFYLDDKSQYNFVNQSIIKASEYFSSEIYAKEICKNIKFLFKKTPYCLTRIINRIFNSDDYLDEFKKNLHLAPSDVMVNVLDAVAIEYPDHKELCEELKKLVQTNAGAHGA